jgi:hypothetical protein
MLGKRRVNIPPERWAEMLRDAGAPEPWVDPEAPYKFAAAITNRAWDAAKPNNTSRRKVQLAIKSLRDEDVMLAMVRSYEGKLTLDKPALSRRIAVRDLARALDHLKQALPITIKQAKASHRDIIRLFSLYRVHVDTSTKISTAAVRFIQAALQAIGHGTVELGTISQALRRWGKTSHLNTFSV